VYSGNNIRGHRWLPSPDLSVEEQPEIVRRVDGLFKLADTIERRVKSGKQRADRHTQSVLAKAFRGELVPTEVELARRENRDYEPASALLERIRAERGERTSSRKPGGKISRERQRRRG